MYTFESFALRQMIKSGRTIRHLGTHSDCMEEAAGEIVDFFFNSFRGLDQNGACALVRCFKTHRFSDLPGHLRDSATSVSQGALVAESTPCLTLLATRGIHPDWNSRHTSSSHRAIPLAISEMISQAPMIANLVQQMGLLPNDFLLPTPEKLASLEERTLDVFHIEHAFGSDHVPAQEQFVKPYGVRSVLGFGGMLPNGELFFVIIFTVVPVTKVTAAMFRTLALSAKLVFLNCMDKPVFAL